MTKKDQQPSAADGTVDGGLVLKHKRAIGATKSKLDDLGTENARNWKAASADGLDKAALKLALAMSRMDSDDARNRYRLTGAYYEAMNPGVLGQRDLFATVAPATEAELTESYYLEVQAAGKTAGRKGKLGQHDHPHDPGTEAAQAWERGWKEGDDLHFAANSEPKSSTGTTVSAPRGRAGLKDDTAAARADIAADLRADAEVKPELKKAGPKKPPASKKAGPKATSKMPVGKGANPKPAKKASNVVKLSPASVPEHEPEPSSDVVEDAPPSANAFDMSSDLTAH